MNQLQAYKRGVILKRDYNFLKGGSLNKGCSLEKGENLEKGYNLEKGNFKKRSYSLKRRKKVGGKIERGWDVD
jgi:hypothetical protein